MAAETGNFSLLIAFFVALYAIVAAFVGERKHSDVIVRSARNGVLVAFGMVSVAMVALFYALMVEDYSISYVWSVTSPDMPLFYRATALWGSQAGSLLFWSFLMAGFAAVAVVVNWRSYRRLMPGVIVYTMAVLAFFLGISIWIENPFVRWWLDNATGQQVIQAVFQPANTIAPSYERLAETANGLNPLLRHFGMAIHPPMLYLGFVGFVIPFAFAMAALASGDLSTNWIKASRRWTLTSWLFLGLGLMLGGRWAYDVLGWGGYWAWDPVENAALLPWLVGTAFLHSVMIQEKRGMLKAWNMALILATFSAVIFGTFATRSGLVESVHSFARSGIGFPMFLFWFGVTFISTALAVWRYNQGHLRDEHEFKSLFSRETLFVVNNVVFIAIFFAVFWWSFGAPITSELFFNKVVTYGAEHFNDHLWPLLLALYILMGVAPLSAWGASSLVRMGKAMVIPFILTILSLSIFVLMGMTTVPALVGYAVVMLAGWVAIYETYRGFMARQRTHDESMLQTVATLLQRNPRRYGGYMIHLGVTIIGIGIIGSTLYQAETQQTLSVGESLFINDYEMRYDQLETGLITSDGRIIDRATVTVIRNGREIAQIRPRRDFFPGTEMNTMTIAGAHSTFENDFYVLLVGWEEITSQQATFKVYVNPLINLIWWGGLVLILGTLAASWPHAVLPVRTREAMRKGK
jgi:cytochrome c-type biogenesis protein CcmF